MTQHAKILSILEDNQWHCSSEFYAQYIADPRKRLCELKEKGYTLISRWCEDHNYHTGHQKQWKLTL